MAAYLLSLLYRRLRLACRTWTTVGFPIHGLVLNRFMAPVTTFDSTLVWCSSCALGESPLPAAFGVRGPGYY
ncbi:hypothetical protein DFH94DRAFT_328940 [Russula ochroleuca]|uniref:Uncharacterized protein n=1 Tax=Russula ochroleuca TaxID=152965 RepID=A0A9P5JTI7_9AGAM|nr:hypothetical protein DFH94DRAFT_483712 [Russula ochroleuca]KAF8483865.1 hypothetical protein DFH94DRAFT_328940 [Russula ochroleuca]